MTADRVAIILGGRSGEHEVSVRSARSVMDALDARRWQPVPIAIARNGDWLSADATATALAGGAQGFAAGGQPLLSASEALRDLQSCSIAFPLVHGTFGEDGTLQGFLEMAGMPYAGCGVSASAIGMDKALMKALFREAGIPVARYGVIRAWDYTPEHFDVSYVDQAAGFPCFVKPANGGSSVGVTLVRSREDLAEALAVAFAYDDKALVEEAVPGQEVECSILGNERPEASMVGEIVPDRDFYDYTSKYADDSRARLLIPAAIESAAAEEVRTLALRMYQIMGCEGYARVDFFVTPGGRVVANEVNTIPGFTSISMYPKLWETSGLPYGELLTRILELGAARHARRARR